MASLTQWAWVWVDSKSLWWTGRPGMLWFMGWQRVGHKWLNWTEPFPFTERNLYFDSGYFPQIKNLSFPLKTRATNVTKRKVVQWGLQESSLRGLTLLIHIAFTSSFLPLSFWKPNMMAGAAATVLLLENEKHAVKIMEKKNGWRLRHWQYHRGTALPLDLSKCLPVCKETR